MHAVQGPPPLPMHRDAHQHATANSCALSVQSLTLSCVCPTPNLKVTGQRDGAQILVSLDGKKAGELEAARWVGGRRQCSRLEPLDVAGGD